MDYMHIIVSLHETYITHKSTSLSVYISISIKRWDITWIQVGDVPNIGNKGILILEQINAHKDAHKSRELLFENQFIRFNGARIELFNRIYSVS